MFFRNYWDVLVVDDEPDVRAISRLALKNLKVYGVPLKIHECGSKAEAVAFFEHLNQSPHIPLALVDVVMETQEAGLELCHHIRESMGNRVTQLVIRTGQAGLAPENDVTDKYDITSYLTKVDATETKLYSTVKTALRLFLHARTFEGMTLWARKVAEGATSRDNLTQTIRAMLPDVTTDSEGRALGSVEAHFAFILDDQVIGAGRFADEQAARAARDELAGIPGREMNPQGDLLLKSGHRCLLQLAPDRENNHASRVEIVGDINFTPVPDFWIRGFLDLMRCIRAHLTHL